jgi:hypothetical protein
MFLSQPPSIPSHELDGRFGTQRPSSSLRRSSRSFNLQYFYIKNFILTEAIFCFNLKFHFFSKNCTCQFHVVYFVAITTTRRE